jgi:L-rhamnose mutarotase
MRQGQRFASVIRLRPEKEAEYRALHADAWPTVLATIRAANIRNYSIFLRDGMLFSYFEYVGSDFAADMARMAEDPETRRWWQLTDPCQQPVETALDGQWWAPMIEVFHSE